MLFIHCLFLCVENSIKYELYNVLSGKSQVRFGTIIQSITSYLNNGEGASPTIEEEKHYKKQETKKLEFFISQNDVLDAIIKHKYLIIS